VRAVFGFAVLDQVDTLLFPEGFRPIALLQFQQYNHYVNCVFQIDRDVLLLSGLVIEEGVQVLVSVDLEEFEILFNDAQ
jgi:hypothetical protein